jgi:hypothetical protein
LLVTLEVVIQGRRRRRNGSGNREADQKYGLSSTIAYTTSATFFQALPGY